MLMSHCSPHPLFFQSDIPHQYTWLFPCFSSQEWSYSDGGWRWCEGRSVDEFNCILPACGLHLLLCYFNELPLWHRKGSHIGMACWNTLSELSRHSNICAQALKMDFSAGLVRGSVQSCWSWLKMNAHHYLDQYVGQIFFFFLDCLMDKCVIYSYDGTAWGKECVLSVCSVNSFCLSNHVILVSNSITDLFPSSLLVMPFPFSPHHFRTNSV